MTVTRALLRALLGVEEVEEAANVGLARVAQLERLSKLLDGQLSVARLVELVEAAQQPLHVLEVELEELRGGYVAVTW